MTPLQSRSVIWDFLFIYFFIYSKTKTSHFVQITQVTVATTVNTVGLILAEIITNWRLAACPPVVITAHSQRLFFHHHTSPSRLAVLDLLVRRALRPARRFWAFITSQRFNCKRQSKRNSDKPTDDENTSFFSCTSDIPSELITPKEKTQNVVYYLLNISKVLEKHDAKWIRQGSSYFVFSYVCVINCLWINIVENHKRRFFR